MSIQKSNLLYFKHSKEPNGLLWTPYIPRKISSQTWSIFSAIYYCPRPTLHPLFFLRLPRRLEMSHVLGFAMHDGKMVISSFVCENKRPNDFCGVEPFVWMSANQIKDRMQLEWLIATSWASVSVKMSFIRIIIKYHFHINGFALSLALKVRFFGTREWPIWNVNFTTTTRFPSTLNADFFVKQRLL